MVAVQEYTYDELSLATSNFSADNLLGEGTFGKVYKGILYHTAVAIKVLNEEGQQGLEDCKRELELLSSVHHPNIVLALGSCRGRPILVFECMENGSLADKLAR